MLEQNDAQRPSVAATSDIRQHFPALTRHTDAGVPIAYFDGPGGTQVPRPVVEQISDYLYHHNANTHWAFPTSAETDHALLQARHALADFLNAAPTEIVFGNNMTTLTYHLSRALAREYQHGDEIVVTELNHHANIAPWNRLEKECGVRLRMARMDTATGQLDWTHFEQQLNSRTRLVAVPAASNALGTIVDVKRAARLAHAAGAQVFVDAVHYAAHSLVDVAWFECDFLSCSAYKFYGPHVGVLYGKYDLLQSLDVPKLLPAPDTAPERFEIGTQNHEGIIGAGAAVNFLASLADEDKAADNRRARLQATFDELHKRGEELTSRVWNGLSEIEGVRVYGPPPSEPRTPTIAFAVEGHQSIDVARRLAAQGVFASHGDFYATTTVERLGFAEEGMMRAGCACYTTMEEVERLIDGVRAIAQGGM